MKYPTDEHAGPFAFGKYLLRARNTEHKRGTNIAKAIVTLPLFPLELITEVLQLR